VAGKGERDVDDEQCKASHARQDASISEQLQVLYKAK